jgi:hypothetical protein
LVLAAPFLCAMVQSFARCWEKWGRTQAVMSVTLTWVYF